MHDVTVSQEMARGLGWGHPCFRMLTRCVCVLCAKSYSIFWSKRPCFGLITFVVLGLEIGKEQIFRLLIEWVITTLVSWFF